MELLTWIFVMRILKVITSIVSFYANRAISQSLYGKSDDIDFEKPLTNMAFG